MKKILVTGSSGFIGSRSVIKLASKNHKIYEIDWRSPSDELKSIAQNRDINLITMDINDHIELKKIMSHNCFDTIIHYAAHWNYKIDYDDMYQKTNIEATKQLHELACQSHVKNFIFASSVEALPYLNHNVYQNGMHPYGWSKAVIEKYFEASQMKISIMRIGGVFSDYCELPPLWWLIRRWSQNNIMGRIIPGCGLTGIPFIHRDDLIDMIITILNHSHDLKPINIFMVANYFKYHGIPTTHEKLFSIIRNKMKLIDKPIFINKYLVSLGLVLEKMIGMNPPEQLWMMDKIDQTNTDFENIKLCWDWRPKHHIEECLVDMLEKYKEQESEWLLKQSKREFHDY
jgi:nucleoside-diphosphate-sugar epimerase